MRQTQIKIHQQTMLHSATLVQIAPKMIHPVEESTLYR